MNRPRVLEPFESAPITDPDSRDSGRSALALHTTAQHSIRSNQLFILNSLLSLRRIDNIIPLLLPGACIRWQSINAIYFPYTPSHLSDSSGRAPYPGSPSPVKSVAQHTTDREDHPLLCRTSDTLSFVLYTTIRIERLIGFFLVKIPALLERAGLVHIHCVVFTYIPAIIVILG